MSSCLGAFKKSNSNKIKKMGSDEKKKVIVKVSSLEELYEIK